MLPEVFLFSPVQIMIEKKEYIKIDTPEHAVLIGLITQGQKEEQVTEYLDELAFLAETAGAYERKRFTQKLSSPDPRTFIGSGKLLEIKKHLKMLVRNSMKMVAQFSETFCVLLQ